MNDLETWLDEMATRPLPGGVSATAVAAAMGAALVAKAGLLTLHRQVLDEADRAALQAVTDQALHRRTELLSLAAADCEAYQDVLDTRALPPQEPARRQAWQAATEVPILVAEACQAIEEGASRLSACCWPAVRMDLRAGGWLLESGRNAGVLAAEVNLQMWGAGAQTQPLRLRLTALKEKQA